jgi:hypothetical protein
MLKFLETIESTSLPPPPPPAETQAAPLTPEEELLKYKQRAENAEKNLLLLREKIQAFLSLHQMPQ